MLPARTFTGSLPDFLPLMSLTPPHFGCSYRSLMIRQRTASHMHPIPLTLPTRGAAIHRPRASTSALERLAASRTPMLLTSHRHALLTGYLECLPTEYRPPETRLSSITLYSNSLREHPDDLRYLSRPSPLHDTHVTYSYQGGSSPCDLRTISAALFCTSVNRSRVGVPLVPSRRVSCRSSSLRCSDFTSTTNGSAS